MNDSDDVLDESPRRRTAQGEHRWPPAIAVLVAALTYALMPNQILFSQRFVVPGLELLLLIALVVSDPVRMTRESRWSRWVSTALAGVIIVTNFVALGQLLAALPAKSADNSSLLIGGMQVWVTGMIGFALLYWELDRGGPVVRRKTARADLPPADWRFSQDENDDAVVEVKATASATSGWIPTFVDYAYMSLTNSSAFSPTDTMPLTTRAKCLMGTQATAALLTSLLVVAKAVGSLGQ
ncbi:hypothetical protein [Calidifontibacter terrae]